MKHKAQLIAAFATILSMASLASAQSIYLNPTQAATNNALATASSWWADAAGTIANTTGLVNNAATASYILTFNDLVTSPSGFSGRTGGGGAGSFFISGFTITNPAGAITVTTAGNANQTVTLNGAVSIDMSTATQNFTFAAGSSSNVSAPAFLRIATAAPATTTWKVGTGRTLTIGSSARNTNGLPNTNFTAQSTGKTLQLVGDGITAMGNIVFHSNVGSNSLAIAIDGTGTSSSGGSVAFNGVTNALGSLSITNATATFASGGTTSGAVTVNSGGVLAGTGTFSGAVTVNGGLRPNAAPVDNTSRITFGNTLTLNSTGATTFDIDGANFTGVTVSTAESLTYGGSLAIDFASATAPGTYDLFNFTDSNTGSFSGVSIGGTYSIPSLSNNSGVWSGTDSGFLFEFTESSGDLVISAVPEPSAFALLAGLAGVGCVGLRRRRRA